MVLLKYLILLLFGATTIQCENCVTYDFGGNFLSTFNNGNPLCYGMAEWNVGNYNTAGIESPSPDTDSFISPGETLSCVSSYLFEMMTTGVLEVYVYMESRSQRDQIVVLANEVSSSGNTVVTGTAMLTPLSNNYFDGWHVLRMTLMGAGTFSGYVSFLGVAAPGSKVIVDSFRYIPPLYEDDCHVYDGEFVTTAPIQRPDPEESEDCVTYNFETDFDNLFNTDRGLCTGFTSWNIENYNSLNIDSPSSESELFITPQSHISCVSSFIFNAEVDGVVEVNVYMKSASDSDQIAVLVNKIADEANDVVTGSIVLTPLHDTYADGWHVLSIALSGDTNYNGYISFLGLASEESIVLIDSFRYIPPKLGNELCNIYEEDVFNTTPLPDTTIAPVGNGEECITFNFESDFDSSFDTNNVLCSGYSSWHLGDYHSLAIDTIDPDSRTFIAPNVTSSCVSSFIFRMLPYGTIEVNVYMESASLLDYIIVLVKKVVPGGVDTVAGFQLYYATNTNFVKGWNVLKVIANDFSAFNGYITLIGSTAEDSTVLIDSFRYIPPNSEEACEIY